MKKSLQFFFLLTAILLPWAVSAQQSQVTLYDAQTNGQIPVNGTVLNNYTCSQMVYPAAQLTEMDQKNITGMTFYLSSPAAAAWSNEFRVYVKEVESQSISEFIDPATATMVYVGHLDATNTIMSIPFTVPYEYHGGNLLIGIENRNVAANVTSATFRGALVTNASVSGYSSTSLSDIEPTPCNFLPTIRFNYTALCAYSAPATKTVFEGNGVLTNNYVPIYGFYADAYLKCQTLYPASDLSDIVNKDITSLTYYASQDNVAWGNAYFKVYMKEVESTTNTAYIDPAAATMVYEGPLSVVNSEMTIQFATPYQYHGGNLLIRIDQTYGYNTVYVSSNFYGEYADGASLRGFNYNDMNEVSVNVENFIPKTTFGCAPHQTILPYTVYENGTMMSNNSTPVCGSSADAYQKCQTIYSASSLSDIADKDIMSLTYYASQASVDWGDAHFKVYLKEVGDAFNTAYIDPDTATMVYEGSLGIVNNEMTIRFATPYHYQGDNLLVRIDQTSGSNITVGSTFFLGKSFTGASLEGYSYTDLDAVPANVSDFIPKTTFGYVMEMMTAHEGDGELTNSYVPIYGLYTDAHLKCQTIYPASDLLDQVDRDITSLTYYANETTIDWGNANFKVYLKAVESMANNAYIDPATATKVYDGKLCVADGRLTIVFNAPYHYQGGNLLIRVDQTNGDNETYASSHFYGEYAEGASLRGYSYDDLDDVTAGVQNFIPKTTFGNAPLQMTEILFNTMNGNSNIPIYGFFADSYLRGQMVYPAENLTQLVSSEISELTFYLQSPASRGWGGMLLSKCIWPSPNLLH